MAAFVNSLAVLKMLNRATIWLNSSTTGYLPKRKGNTCSQLYSNVHSCLVLIAPKWIQLKGLWLTGEWMNQVWNIQAEEYYSSIKKQLSIDTCNIDEPWKHYAMRESRYKRANIVWFHWYEMCRISQSIETESKLSVCQGLGERRLGRPANRHGGFIWGWWKWSRIH